MSIQVPSSGRVALRCPTPTASSEYSLRHPVWPRVCTLRTTVGAAFQTPHSGAILMKQVWVCAH